MSKAFVFLNRIDICSNTIQSKKNDHLARINEST